jgi:hypothetical protein
MEDQPRDTVRFNDQLGSHPAVPIPEYEMLGLDDPRLVVPGRRARQSDRKAGEDDRKADYLQPPILSLQSNQSVEDLLVH